MQQINIHPQVLLNISQHVSVEKEARLNRPIQIGILLGCFNQKLNKTDIVDSFECLYMQKQSFNSDEKEFLIERMRLRVQGDRWNLFKYLDIVGWYTTSTKPTEYLGLHYEIATIVDQNSTENTQNFLKYLLCFNSVSATQEIYELDEGKVVQFRKLESLIVPQAEEMICITSAVYQNQSLNNAYSNKKDEQRQLLNQMEQLLSKLLQALEKPEVCKDAILLRRINELIISYPKIEPYDLQREYTKLQLVSYFQALMKINEKIKQLQQQQM